MITIELSPESIHQLRRLRRTMRDIQRQIDKLFILPGEWLYPRGRVPHPRLVVDNTKEPGHADT